MRGQVWSLGADPELLRGPALNQSHSGSADGNGSAAHAWLCRLLPGSSPDDFVPAALIEFEACLSLSSVRSPRRSECSQRRRQYSTADAAWEDIPHGAGGGQGHLPLECDH